MCNQIENRDVQSSYMIKNAASAAGMGKNNNNILFVNKVLNLVNE